MKSKTTFYSVLWLATLWLSVTVVPAYGVQVTDIYQALLPVDDQSEGQRDAGVKQGLAQVLVKVSGDSGVLANPRVRGVLANAARYVSEVGYSEIQLPGQEQPSLALSASYSQQQVDRLLRREQLQIWPASRSELLVWVVVDTLEGGKQLVDAEHLPEVLQSLEYHMARRSAPLLKPSLDLQDRLTLPAAQAWQFNREKLQLAAGRYQVENWLAIRLYQTSQGEWRGASWLNASGQMELQNFAEPDVDTLIGRAVDKAVDRMAANYAFVPQLRVEPVALILENIGSFQDFNTVTAYLETLEVVREVRVESVDADRLSLQLLVDGDVQLLLDMLQRDQRFQQIAAHNPLMVSQYYRFRWDGERAE